MSQAQLAAAAGVDTRQIRRYEAGEQQPLLPVAVAIADARDSSGEGYKSERHPWTFDVHREDGGWRLTKVKPYPWCGAYVQQSHCP
jgi:transcriptional regulator with XRE-family HTH domain